MRTATALLFLCLAASVHAEPWKSVLFRCAANLPDSGGWQAVTAPQVPGITVLVARQNPTKQSAFGITIVEKVTATRIDVPATREALEATLKKFSYEFAGYSTIRVGGIEWLQFSVRTGSGRQQMAGVVRFASAGGYVFGISLLRGGGQDAAQDEELQQSAASFRIIPSTDAAVSGPARPSVETGPKQQPPAADDESQPSENQNLRFIWYVGAGIVGLFLLLKIIAGGNQAGKR